jgi:hypothetical protein
MICLKEFVDKIDIGKSNVEIYFPNAVWTVSELLNNNKGYTLDSYYVKEIDIELNLSVYVQLKEKPDKTKRPVGMVVAEGWNDKKEPFFTGYKHPNYFKLEGGN